MSSDREARDRPRVSVIMNCLNGDRYLREALDSVEAQTLTDWEIVFWDNGSTDSSAAIAQSYGPRVRYFYAAETTTLGAARNLAVKQARGDYIAFLDCDDRWYPDTLARLVTALEAHGVSLCYGGVTEVDGNGRPLRTVTPAARSGMLLPALLRQFDINVPAVLLRRVALERTGLAFDPMITASEEYCLFMQLAVTEPIRAIAEPVAYYRVHDASLTNRAIGKWASEREYTLERVLARNPSLRERYRAEFAESFARAEYYRARFEMASGRPGVARAALRRAIGVHPRYAFLYILSFLPYMWHRVHYARAGRRDLAPAPEAL